MEKVAVIGPFDKNMRNALETAFKGDFVLQYISDYDEYEKAYDAHYVILRTLCLHAEHITAMKNVKLIQRWGAGFDTVDIQTAGRQGIPVAVTAGMNSIPVAEMAVALALAVYRNIVPLTNGMMNGKWERERYCGHSFTIHGKTIGIIGMGNIGKKAAELFNAFGAHIVYYDPFRLPEKLEKEMNIIFMELDKLLTVSDIISLHAPLTQATNGIINAERIGLMKKNAVLINTAREELVDMQAVAEALRNGNLAGAAFDAIENETVKNNPFLGMENVLLTPHLGGNTADNAIRMAKQCARQITCISKGGKLQAPSLVNGQFLQI